MVKWIVVGLAALCCLSVGEALTCYYCPLGLCIIPTTTTCSFGEMCDTATATVSASIVGLSIKGKGCLSAFSCAIPSTENYNGIEVSVSHSCCFGSLCNAGSLARPSLLAGLLTLMATLLMTFL
ncbi:uncharacterized protein LOC144756305 [Lissotriton helveticus]